MWAKFTDNPMFFGGFFWERRNIIEVTLCRNLQEARFCACPRPPAEPSLSTPLACKTANTGVI
jgi:hypothetical protein